MQTNENRIENHAMTDRKYAENSLELPSYVI